MPKRRKNWHSHVNIRPLKVALFFYKKIQQSLKQKIFLSFLSNILEYPYGLRDLYILINKIKERRFYETKD